MALAAAYDVGVSMPDERSDVDLLRAWAQATKGLKERGLIPPTGTSPVGSYAAHLVQRAFDARRAPVEKRNVDLVFERAGSEHGIQVRARRASDNGSEPVSFEDIRGLQDSEKQPFTALMGIVFDWDFQVKSAWRIERHLVCLLARDPSRKRTKLPIDRVRHAHDTGVEGIESIADDIRQAIELKPA
jgi:hypothetical protein